MTDEVTEEYKRVYNEGLYDLVGKPYWKRTYGRTSGRWHDNIKIDI
jgi:hypothetical protein